MRRYLSAMAISVAIGATALAQTTAPPQSASEQRDQRYQIRQMERLLEGAVEHGAKVTRDRLETLVPSDQAGLPAFSSTALLSDDARVRGYRLENYGVFFDVAVPMLGWSLTWSIRTLDQNDLGLQSALTALRSLVAKTGDTNLDQALKRIELQVAPVSLNAAAPAAPAAQSVADARTLTGSAAVTVTAPDAVQAKPDPILDDPVEAFRTEIKEALMNAMLDHGGALRLSGSDLLTVAARGSDDRSVLGPLNDDAQTTMISVRWTDLAAYISGQISREEVRQRMTVRVF